MKMCPFSKLQLKNFTKFPKSCCSCFGYRKDCTSSPISHTQHLSRFARNLELLMQEGTLWNVRYWNPSLASRDARLNKPMAYMPKEENLLVSSLTWASLAITAREKFWDPLMLKVLGQHRIIVQKYHCVLVVCTCAIFRFDMPAPNDKIKCGVSNADVCTIKIFPWLVYWCT